MEELHAIFLKVFPSTPLVSEFPELIRLALTRWYDFHCSNSLMVATGVQILVCRSLTLELSMMVMLSTLSIYLYKTMDVRQWKWGW